MIFSLKDFSKSYAIIILRPRANEYKGLFN
jgi:hypothetical protein